MYDCRWFRIKRFVGLLRMRAKRGMAKLKEKDIGKCFKKNEYRFSPEKETDKVTNTIIITTITATMPNKNKIPAAAAAAAMENLRFNDILINDSIYGVCIKIQDVCINV